MLAALFLVLMFCGLLVGYKLLVGAAAAMVLSLYAWLTSPLEPEHH